MRYSRSNNMRDWARVAAKIGVLLCEPKVRAAIGRRVKNRVESATDVIAGKYEDAIERMEAAETAFRRGRRSWSPGIAGILFGIAAGTGIGLLLAPGVSNTAGKIREAMTR